MSQELGEAQNPLPYHEIATHLTDAESILEEIRRQKHPRPNLETAFIAPRTPTEQTLADIGMELLSLAQVGIEDDFFELGGHSLLAIEFLTRVRDSFQIDLPMETLFEDTFTIAKLAQSIEEHLIADMDDDELAGMLAELDNLSDEEISELLAQEGSL